MAEECRKSVLTIMLWLVCCGMYLCLGMVVFVAIEADHTDRIIARKNEMRESIHKELESKMNISKEHFDNIMNRISEAFSPPPMQWTYLRAFALSLQTITTIGYGYITPLTTEGRVFCIFYALFGIPLAALLLQATGNTIFGLLCSSIVKIEKKVKREPEVQNAEFKSLITSLFLLSLVILVFAAVFGYKEDRYIEGVYGWFITLTTIGYGDVIPGHHSKHLAYVWLRVFLMFIGLSFTASILSSLGSWIGSRNLKMCNCCSGLTSRIFNRQRWNGDNVETEMGKQRGNEGNFRKKDEQADHCQHAQES